MADLIKGGVGSGASFLAVISSMQEQFEYWMRILSLLGGLAVAVVTVWSILKRSRR